MRILYGLAALFAGVLVAVLVHRTGFHHTSGIAEARNAEAGRGEQSSSNSESLNLTKSIVIPRRSVADTPSRPVGRDHSDRALVDERAMPQTRIDEDSARRRLRETATREIRGSYSLLFEDLGLTRQEEDELFSLLVEGWMAGATVYHRGKTVQVGRRWDENERSSKVAAIIGDPKLEQFLALEQNLASYREVRSIESMLERRGAPLTEAQRDGLFDILAATRNREYAPMPSAHLDPYSLEQLERTLTRMDERERHVIQLAPSVISPQQVVDLHERYQDCSYKRANALERQRRQRAADPTNPRPVHYSPCSP